MQKMVIANIEGTIRTYQAAGDKDMIRYWTNILAMKQKEAETPSVPFVSRKEQKRQKKFDARMRRYED